MNAIMKSRFVRLEDGSYTSFKTLDTKCDRKTCGGVAMPCRYIEFTKESRICAVCYEDLKGRQLAFLMDCEHVFCANCIRQNRVYTFKRCPEIINTGMHQCPLCRKDSRAAIYSKHMLYGNLDFIYSFHRRCLESVNYIAHLRTSITNPIWWGLFKLILEYQADVKYPFILDAVKSSYLALAMVDPNCVAYISRLDRSRRSFKLIAFCIVHGISIQLMFSTEPLSYDINFYDNEYADKVVAMLNDKRMIEALHKYLNPEFNRFLMWRKLDNFHCALKIDRIVKKPPFEPSEGDISAQLGSLKPHNFYGEVVKSLSDDVVDEKDLQDYFDGDIRHNISRFMFPKIAVDVEVREIHLSNRHPSSPVA